MCLNHSSQGYSTNCKTMLNSKSCRWILKSIIIHNKLINRHSEYNCVIQYGLYEKKFPFRHYYTHTHTHIHRQTHTRTSPHPIYIHIPILLSNRPLVHRWTIRIIQITITQTIHTACKVHLPSLCQPSRGHPSPKQGRPRRMVQTDVPQTVSHKT